MFKTLGTHHEWHPAKNANAAALIACSSSGRPVSFSLDSSNLNCALATDASGRRIVRALQVVADCTVTASQPGGGAYAAAPNVTQRYVVDFLRVSVEVQGPDERSTLKAGGSASITVKLTAKWPILLDTVSFIAQPDDKVCRPPDPWKSINSGTNNSISNTFPVALLAAGNCYIEVAAGGSQYVSGDSDEVQFMVKQ